MRRCRSEGELLAYLDRELAPEEMDRLAAHLPECGRCREALAELAARAARVTSLLESVPQPEPCVSVPRLRVVSRKLPRLAMAAALAACLALAFLATHRRPKVVVGRAVPAPVRQGIQPATPAPPPPVVQAAAPARKPATAPKANAVSKPRPDVKYFLALDDEPIDTGVVMRVALGPEEIPADVVFSPDGRPRAVRLVNAVAAKGEFR